MDWERAAEQNRRAWEEIADLRSRSFADSTIPASLFASGESILDPRVVAAAGDVRGAQLLHLMCATGEESLSWATLGAKVTGVDFSVTSIALAREKADAAGLEVEFVESDIGALHPAMLASDYDLVYMASGVLVWIPEIDRWAATVAATLRRGGRLLLWEEHPISMVLWGRGPNIEVVANYFRRANPETSTGWNHFEGGEDASETKFEFGWGLGDVVNALIGNGLRIERLDEYPSDSTWRFGDAFDTARNLPGLVLLTARKE